MLINYTALLINWLIKYPVTKIYKKVIPKNTKMKYILLISSILANFFAFSSGFCYEDANCGPDSEEWPELCHIGKFQSPIDIHSNRSSKPLKKLHFNADYKKTHQSFYIQNNGHTIQIQLTPDLHSDAHMSGYEMDGHYIFAQMHFHWGSEDRVGSEHLVNGHSFTMEVHFVHYNSKYPNFSEAAKVKNDSTALSVVAVFLEVDSKHEEKHMALESILKNVSPEYQSEPQLVHSPLKLHDFLPFGTGQRFFRYFGSLTTPPCSEIVLWTVFEDPMYITHEEVQGFRNIYTHSADHKHLNATTRPVQPFGDRILEELSELNEP